MKKILSLLVLLCVGVFALAANGDGRRESRREIAEKLYGKIRFVSNNPDFCVKFVESCEDLRVKLVSSFPDKPGLWQIVEYGEDFTVKPVTSAQDICVKIVTRFEGPAGP
ncbi:MAG: hypothetical protein ACI4P6_02705 [Candidatus Spyradosoma sp.]